MTEWTPEMEAVCVKHGADRCEKNEELDIYDFLYNHEGYRAYEELQATFTEVEFWYATGLIGMVAADKREPR